MTTRDSEVKIVGEAVSRLAEHFDTVHIFVSRHAPTEHDGTVTVQKGCGNWHARIGQIMEFIWKEKNSARWEE